MSLALTYVSAHRLADANDTRFILEIAEEVEKEFPFKTFFGKVTPQCLVWSWGIFEATDAGGDTVGFIAFRQHHPERRVFTETLCGVRKDMRRQGIYKAMWKSFVDHIEDLYKHDLDGRRPMIMSETHDKNEAMLAAYRSTDHLFYDRKKIHKFCNTSIGIYAYRPEAARYPNHDYACPRLTCDPGTGRRSRRS